MATGLVVRLPLEVVVASSRARLVVASEAVSEALEAVVVVYLLRVALAAVRPAAIAL
jgi:hypothetical protein